MFTNHSNDSTPTASIREQEPVQENQLMGELQLNSFIKEECRPHLRKGTRFVKSTTKSIDTTTVTDAPQNATFNPAKGKPKRGSSGVAAVATVTSVTEAVEQEKVLLITS